MPIRLILNQHELVTDENPSMVVLDFIRRSRRLMGTKIGCREGDCGACTVLVGSLEKGAMVYRSMTSCLMPLVNAAGKHLVTIEGLNRDELTPIQQAIVDEGGTQCGFCTVGFVVSLAGWCLGRYQPSYEEAIAAMDGNICRCTGYKSLERAARRLCAELAEKPMERPVPWLVEQGFLPAYFAHIPKRLEAIHTELPDPTGAMMVGGGTDLYVQRPEEMQEHALRPMLGQGESGISEKGGHIVLDGSVTAEQIKRDPLMVSLFPRLKQYLELVSSTPIRNMGTVAGNFVNASPIGDLTVFFLALDARIQLEGGTAQRQLALKDFYLGYKQLDKTEAEWISRVSFAKPTDFHFNFEKVSKRTYLDIASVNTAAGLVVRDGMVVSAHLSAGGVAPVPKYLAETSAFLVGKPINGETARLAGEMALTEVAPISDTRGAADYKRLLLRQLVYAHFVTLFPTLVATEALV